MNNNNEIKTYKIADFKQKIVDKVIQNLETNNTIWSKGFVPLKSYNFATDNAYRGCNQLILAVMGERFNDPRWMTFKQAKKLNFFVKKGSVSTDLIVYDKQKIYVTENEAKQLTETNKSIKIMFDKAKNKNYYEKPFLKKFAVFNGEQINGISQYIPAAATITHEMLDAFVDKIVKVSPIKINESVLTETANYKHSNFATYESINIPHKSTFKSTEERFSTLIHELAHASGASNRLDRHKSSGSKFGSKEYAREELVAGMTEMFVAQEYGIEKLDNNHIAYIKSWIQNLKDNPNELFIAANRADKATEWLNENVLDKALSLLKIKTNEEYVDKANSLYAYVQENQTNIKEEDEREK